MDEFSTTNDQLAIHGGSPVFPGGMPCWPLDDPLVRQSLATAYADGDWGRYHGKYCEKLRSALAAFHDVPFVQLCCSGTIGVELALRSVGVRADDEVVLAGYDFSGNFRAIENIGAKPVLIDVGHNGWTMQPELLQPVVSNRTRAIFVSHMHSELARMSDLVSIANAHGIPVVEDACQSPGANVSGRVAGTLGDIGVISFGGSKLLTSGRGGAVFTKNESIFQRAKIYCERGNDAFALSELQAAALIPQIEQLADRNVVRQINARRIISETDRSCGLDPLSAFQPRNAMPKDSATSFYKISWLLNAEVLKKRSIDSFIAAMRAEGIDMNAGFRGFTKRSEKRCRRPVSLHESETASTATVVLHHPVLLKPSSIIDQLIVAIIKVANAWARGDLP